MLLAPAGVPDAIAGLLEREVQLALKRRRPAGEVSRAGLEAVGSSGAEARARLRADTELWARIVKLAKMQVD